MSSSQLFLCPCAYLSQILGYLEACCAPTCPTLDGVGPTPATPSLPGSPRTSSLPAQSYLDAMASSRTLRDLTRNPFVLRLFVDALPSLVASGSPTALRGLTRHAVYHAFVRQWFDREVGACLVQARWRVAIVAGRDALPGHECAHIGSTHGPRASSSPGSGRRSGSIGGGGLLAQAGRSAGMGDGPRRGVYCRVRVPTGFSR